MPRTRAGSLRLQEPGDLRRWPQRGHRPGRRTVGRGSSNPEGPGRLPALSRRPRARHHRVAYRCRSGAGVPLRARGARRLSTRSHAFGDSLANRDLSSAQIVGLLQVQPDCRRRPEVARKPEGRIGGDAPARTNIIKASQPRPSFRARHRPRDSFQNTLGVQSAPRRRRFAQTLATLGPFSTTTPA